MNYLLNKNRRVVKIFDRDLELAFTASRLNAFKIKAHKINNLFILRDQSQKIFIALANKLTVCIHEIRVKKSDTYCITAHSRHQGLLV
ncbi:MAG: hypothetical protein PHH11_13495 [Methylomonas sp.]|nr:hypothetical protein [Methylomonas sp.]